MPELDKAELEEALSQLKGSKVARKANILPEILKESDSRTKQELVKLFNKFLT